MVGVPMELMLMGLLGALLPDTIRLAKDRFDTVGVYLTKPGYYFGLAAQVAIGLVAVVLGSPENQSQALALGFAGPEFVTRTLGAAAAPPAAQPKMALSDNSNQAAWIKMLNWWAK